MSNKDKIKNIKGYFPYTKVYLNEKLLEMHELITKQIYIT